MIKVRTENEITVRLTVNRDGEPFSIKPTEVILRTLHVGIKLSNFKVEGNVLAIVVPSVPKLPPGIYYFTIVSEGDVTDTADCFEIVPRTPREDVNNLKKPSQITIVDIDVNGTHNYNRLYNVPKFNGMSLEETIKSILNRLEILEK